MNTYEILRQIAYPKRGTHEETATIHDFAERIQSEFTLENLEDNIQEENCDKATIRLLLEQISLMRQETRNAQQHGFATDTATHHEHDHRRLAHL